MKTSTRIRHAVCLLLDTMIRLKGKDYWEKTALVGTVVIVRTIVILHILFDIFHSKFRPMQNIKYAYCYFVCNVWCFGVWELLLLVFFTPRPDLHHYLAIHTERAKPTFRPSQACTGNLGRSWSLSRAEGRVRASLGESLNVCISARIPLPLSQLTFINVCGGT